MFVDDVEDLVDPPGRGDVELVAERPDVVRVVGVKPVGWRRGVAHASALASLRGPSSRHIGFRHQLGQLRSFDQDDAGVTVVIDDVAPSVSWSWSEPVDPRL